MIIMTMIFLFLSISYPVLDYFWMKRINRNKEQFNKNKMYKQIVLIQWGTVAIIALYWLIAGNGFDKLGFVNPMGTIAEFSGMIFGLLIGLSINLFLMMKLKPARKWFYKQMEAIEFMLPANMKERLWFALVAITAGFCEEVMFRGFMFHYFKSLPFDLSLTVVAIISSIIFGLAHLYQGWKNVLITGIIGFALARAFMNTGTIWIPIIIHIVIDLRMCILPSRKKVKENLQQVEIAS